jgi:hypothetical protein
VQGVEHVSAGGRSGEQLGSLVETARTVTLLQ